MSTRACFLLLGGWCLAFSAGCADLAYRVPRSMLRELSVENKLALFEAENEVAIAWDEREQAMRKIQVIKFALTDAEKQWDDAKESEARAKKKNSAKAAQVAAVAIKTFLAKIEFLEAMLNVARERYYVKESVLTVALARFELAKATLVKKNSIAGAEDIELENFEGQVDHWVQRARSRQEDLAGAEKGANERKKVYMAQRDLLDKTSGGGLGSPWVEDATPWLDQ
jgi:hypothetical protein